MCQFVILILKLFKNYRKAYQIECQITLSHPRKTINPPPLSLNVTGHAYKQKHKQFNKIYLHRYSVAILISSTRIWEIVSSRLLSTILEELVTVSIRYLNRLIRKKKKKKKKFTNHRDRGKVTSNISFEKERCFSARTYLGRVSRYLSQIGEERQREREKEGGEMSKKEREKRREGGGLTTRWKKVWHSTGGEF